MNLVLWIASFVYLSLVCGWVTTAVREGYGNEADPPRSTAANLASFFVMMLGATLLFGVGIAIFEWLA